MRWFCAGSGSGRLICILCLAAAILCISASSGAQTLTAPAIRVRSNLVLVPVFVYNKKLVGGTWPEFRKDFSCAIAQQKALRKMTASEPYVPTTDCDEAEVRGLKLRDFRLFDDGVEQKIQSVTTADWAITVRDNATWHFEWSHTPVGRWSSPDLGKTNLLPSLRSGEYILTYVPPRPGTGHCHKLNIKVDRRGVRVFARKRYCDGQSPSDPLFGTKPGKRLERRLTSRKDGKIPLRVRAGFFRVSPDEARVEVALEFPWRHLSFDWEHGSWAFWHLKLWSYIRVLGAFYTTGGKLAGRFSDSAYPSYWPTFLEGESLFPMAGLAGYLTDQSNRDPGWLPTRCETQIVLSPGKYDLRVVLSDGREFGRAVAPLTIKKYDGKGLAMSSVMLCRRYRDAHVAKTEAAAANLAPQYVPLVSKGVQFRPVGDTRFKKFEPLIAYFQVYEPLLAAHPPPAVEAHMKILSAKTDKLIKTFHAVNAAPYEQPGSTTISIARKIPFAKLPKGGYLIEVQATDSAGRSTPWRTADFTVR